MMFVDNVGWDSSGENLPSGGLSQLSGIKVAADGADAPKPCGHHKALKCLCHVKSENWNGNSVDEDSVHMKAYKMLGLTDEEIKTAERERMLNNFYVHATKPGDKRRRLSHDQRMKAYKMLGLTPDEINFNEEQRRVSKDEGDESKRNNNDSKINTDAMSLKARKLLGAEAPRKKAIAREDSKSSKAMKLLGTSETDVKYFDGVVDYSGATISVSTLGKETVTRPMSRLETIRRFRDEGIQSAVLLSKQYFHLGKGKGKGKAGTDSNGPNSPRPTVRKHAYSDPSSLAALLGNVPKSSEQLSSQEIHRRRMQAEAESDTGVTTNGLSRYRRSPSASRAGVGRSIMNGARAALEVVVKDGKDFAGFSAGHATSGQHGHVLIKKNPYVSDVVKNPQKQAQKEVSGTSYVETNGLARYRRSPSETYEPSPWRTIPGRVAVAS